MPEGPRDVTGNAAVPTASPRPSHPAGSRTRWEPGGSAPGGLTGADDGQPLAVTSKPKPATTPDGHHVVIDGRRWRATDPDIDEDASARLRVHLMAARRAVGAALRAEDPEAERAARDRVQVAKVALGERGVPWWEQSAEERRTRWTEGLAALDAGDDPP